MCHIVKSNKKTSTAITNQFNMVALVVGILSSSVFHICDMQAGPVSMCVWTSTMVEIQKGLLGLTYLGMSAKSYTLLCLNMEVRPLFSDDKQDARTPGA